MEIYLRNLQRAKKLNLPRIKRDLARALRLLDLTHTELSVVFVGNARMRRLNARHRGIDKNTDVLSFPLWDSSSSADGARTQAAPYPLGDIVICVPRAADQARDYGASFQEELRRLMIHGLLHLAGYDHETNSYQKKKMQIKERELFEALRTMA